jgi:hypothetical protein
VATSAHVTGNPNKSGGLDGRTSLRNEKMWKKAKTIESGRPLMEGVEQFFGRDISQKIQVDSFMRVPVSFAAPVGDCIPTAGRKGQTWLAFSDFGNQTSAAD